MRLVKDSEVRQMPVGSVVYVERVRLSDGMPVRMMYRGVVTRVRVNGGMRVKLMSVPTRLWPDVPHWRDGMCSLDGGIGKLYVEEDEP